MTSILSHPLWRLLLLLLLCFLFFGATASGQVLDPDTCWTCRDSRKHVLAGALVDQGAALVLRYPWQRVAATAIVGVTFEVGQYDAARRTGKLGHRGYGVSLKDIGCDIIGALTRETVWALIKRRR